MGHRLVVPVTLALGMATFLLCMPEAGAVRMRQDVDNGLYLEGRLAWSGGLGSIRWTDSASEDPGGPRGDGAADSYESEPLPRGLRINSSRLIQVDVYTKDAPTPTEAYGSGSSCAGGTQIPLGAELFAGDKLVGWTDETKFNMGIPASDSTHFPPDPPGYGVCRIRLASEVGSLAAGSVLRLRLIHGSTGGYPQYGFAGDHSSILRIPYFSEEDAAYRFPSYAHGGPGGAAPGGPGGLLGLGLLAPAVGLLASRRRETALLVLLATSLLPLAGCLAPAGAPRAGPDSNELDEGTAEPIYQKSELSGSGNGSLTGQVTSAETGEPLEGAHALLLGTAAGTTTDPYGRFTFRDLRPASYRLRIDHETYRSVETDVLVQADLLARLDVRLTSLVSDPAKRPHRHDYWGGDSERVLMDNVNLGTTDSCTTVSCKPVPIASFVVPPPADGVQTIFPGTYDVNITLSWGTSGNTAKTAGLMFQANNDPSFGNWSVLRPRAPGEPFHIATTWEMSDSGHQRFSTWIFSVTGFYSSAPDPTITVSLRIGKGIVPVEPVHPDFWKGGSTVEVLAPGKPVWASSSYASAWDLSWLPARIIPLETQWLEVDLKQSREIQPAYEVEFRFKPANALTPASCLAYPDYNDRGYNCHGPEYRVVSGRKEGLTTRFQIRLLADEADPFYAARSSFSFGLASRDEPANNALTGVDANAHPGPEGALTYVLKVVAHRDAPPG